eukprot:scaffold1292_cov105-Skeletonema_menzelii.AAC.1
MDATNVKSNQSIQRGQSPKKDSSTFMGLPKAGFQDDVDASSYLKTSTGESNVFESLLTEVTDATLEAFAMIFTTPKTDNIQSSGVYPNNDIHTGKNNGTDNNKTKANAHSDTIVNEMTLKSKIPLLRRRSFPAKKGPVCKDHSEISCSTGDSSAKADARVFTVDNKTKANVHAPTTLKSKLPLLRKRSAKDDGSRQTCSDSSRASTKVKVPAKEPFEEPFKEPFKEPFEEEEPPEDEDFNIFDKIFDAFFPDDDASSFFSFIPDPEDDFDFEEDEFTGTRDFDQFTGTRAGKTLDMEKKRLGKRRFAKLKKHRKRLADENIRKKLDKKDEQIEILCQQLNDKRKRTSVRTTPTASQKNVPGSPKKKPVNWAPSQPTHPSPDVNKKERDDDKGEALALWYTSTELYESPDVHKKERDDDEDEALAEILAFPGSQKKKPVNWAPSRLTHPSPDVNKKERNDDEDKDLALWFTSTELLALNQAVNSAITIARSQDAASITSEPVSCSSYEIKV